MKKLLLYTLITGALAGCAGGGAITSKQGGAYDDYDGFTPVPLNTRVIWPEHSYVDARYHTGLKQTLDKYLAFTGTSIETFVPSQEPADWEAVVTVFQVNREQESGLNYMKKGGCAVHQNLLAHTDLYYKGKKYAEDLSSGQASYYEKSPGYALVPHCTVDQTVAEGLATDMFKDAARDILRGLRRHYSDYHSAKLEANGGTK